jgi:hypothetical protein
VLLPIYVKPLSSDPFTDIVMPLLFWPFSGNLGLPEMKIGRNEEYWHQRIAETWGIEAFGSKENFLESAAQLEFVLELNSYLFMNFSDPKARDIDKQFPEKRLRYLPDFWSHPLDPAFPIALQIFDSLTSGSGFPSDLALEPALTENIFRTMSLGERKLFYGEFLSYLQKWQSDAMLQAETLPILGGVACATARNNHRLQNAFGTAIPPRLISRSVFSCNQTSPMCSGCSL